jgi:hypothetical protein
MSHVRPLVFDALEHRVLLSKGHVGVLHAVPAVAAAPLVLDGSLAVDNNGNAASTSMNLDGSTTTSVPVAGRLGTLGEVRGVWNKSVDAFGNPTGLDTLRLHNSRGAFVVAFNGQQPVRAQPAPHRAVYYRHPQRLSLGTGAYAGASESGTIELVTNSARTVVQSMTLASRTT